MLAVSKLELFGYRMVPLVVILTSQEKIYLV